MGNMRFSLFLILFLFPFLGKSMVECKINNDTSIHIYKGGIDSLHKHIERSLVRSMPDLKQDHFFFFEVIVGSKGFQTVKQLYREETEISKWVISAIDKSANMWMIVSQKDIRVVIPVFLFGEKRNADTPFQKISANNMFESHKNFRDCFLVPPIVIMQYLSSHQNE
jgi:hypothetical protein